MGYTEIRPHGALARYVACYWTMETDDAARRGPHPVRRVLPDGCADLLFNLGPPFIRHQAEGPVARPEGGYVVGVMHRAVVVEQAPGARVFAVRFRPGGAAAFLGAGQHALADRVEPLSERWGAAGRDLAAQVAAAAGTAARIERMEAALVRRFTPEADDALVYEAVRRLEQHAGQCSVEALADELGVGVRRLERRFLAVVGQRPKALGRVLRLQHTLRLLATGPQAPWAQLALEGGYYDQAHFIREVRALAGTTPTGLRA